MTPCLDLSPLSSSSSAPHPSETQPWLRTHPVSPPLVKPHPQTPFPKSHLPPLSLPFHPFPDQLFPFFLVLIGEPPGPQEPLGLILEGGQVPAGAGREGIAAAGAAHRAGGRCLRLGGVLQGRERGGEGWEGQDTPLPGTGPWGQRGQRLQEPLQWSEGGHGSAINPFSL